MRITLVLANGCVPEDSIRRLLEIFDWANSYSPAIGLRRPFDVTIVGLSSTIELYGRTSTVETRHFLTSAFPSELVIVPAVAGNVATAIEQNRSLVPWIAEQYAKGSQLAGLCTGALFFADMTVLKDISCRKTWFVSENFRHQFSHISSAAENVLRATEDIRTDRGAFSFVYDMLKNIASSRMADDGAGIFEASFNQAVQSVFSLTGVHPADEKKFTIETHGPIGRHNHCENFVAHFDSVCSRSPPASTFTSENRHKNSTALKTILVAARKRAQ